MGDGTGVGDGDDFWKISNQTSFEYLYNANKKSIFTLKIIPKIYFQKYKMQPYIKNINLLKRVIK